METLKEQLLKTYPKIEELNNNLIKATIKINNETYEGYAKCCDLDNDFYSIKVGTNIATLRAVYKVFKKEKIGAKYHYQQLKKNNDINAALAYEYFLTCRFWVEEVAAELNNYLKAQDKVVESLKRFRSKKDN